MDENRTPAPEEQSLNEVLQIRRDKLRELQAAGKDPFELVKYVRTANSAEIINNFEAMEGKEVSVAGRMMLRREMGKASFADLMDRDGKIQIYVKIDDVGEQAYADFRKWDIGDIFGVKGTVFRHAPWGNFHSRHRADPAGQVAAAASENPWPQGR